MSTLLKSPSKPKSSGLGKIVPGLLLMLVIIVVGLVGKRHLEKLAEAGRQSLNDSSGAELVIILQSDGNFLVDSQTLAPEEFELLFQQMVTVTPNQAVIIKAGKDTDLKQVMDAVEKFQNSGIANVTYSTAP